MFENFLESIGWKDYYGRWVASEIRIDILMLTAVALAAYFIAS